MSPGWPQVCIGRGTAGDNWNRSHLSRAREEISVLQTALCCFLSRRAVALPCWEGARPGLQRRTFPHTNPHSTSHPTHKNAFIPKTSSHSGTARGISHKLGNCIQELWYNQLWYNQREPCQLSAFCTRVKCVICPVKILCPVPCSLLKTTKYISTKKIYFKKQ